MITTDDPDFAALLGVARKTSEVAEVPASLTTPEQAGSQLVMNGAYEGASRFDNQVALWTPRLNSADGDILPEKAIIDARSRDSIRNDAYVQSGQDIHKDNIVGSMYALNAKPEYKVLGLDEKWAEEFQEEAETKFTLYAESPSNWIDASRGGTLTSLVRQAVGTHLACGEALASVEWMRDGTRPFHTAVQMIDLDRLSNPNGISDTPTLRGGIERNSYGAAIGYHIRMAHPGDYMNDDKWRWKYVNARKPWGRLQMLHLFERIRPDQTRGVTSMVAALKELRITKKFRDIVLQNAVVNATYAASIESDMPSEAVFAALGGGTGDIGKAINGYAGAYLSAIGAYSGSARNLQIDGVKIPHLFPGTKLQLRPAGQGGPLGTEFEQSLLRYISAMLGVSYEQLSRDYSQTNYSAVRAAMTETWKYMQSRKKIVADRFASHIYELWLEEAINSGAIESMPRNAPSFYEGQNKEAYTACEWVGASKGQIDELKETQAAALRIRNGLSTWEDELARLGKDWRKVFAQRQREERIMKERGLDFLGKDNMMNAASGTPSDATVGGAK